MLDNSRRNLLNDQQNLLSDIRLKENRVRVDQLESALQDFASKNDLLRVKSQFEQYTTLVSFNKVRMEQEEINKQTKVMEKMMVIRQELEAEIAKLKDHINEVNQVNATKSECAKDKKDTLEIIDKLQHEFQTLKEDHRKSKDRIRKLEVKIDTKANQIDLSEVKEHLKILPTTDELNQMRLEMRQTLEKYNQERDEFSSEFKTHVQIIQRYDEIMADKANKHSLYESVTKVKNKFKSLINDLNEKVESNNALIKEQKQYFEAFREMISSEVYSTIKTETRNEIRLHESELIKA